MVGKEVCKNSERNEISIHHAQSRMPKLCGWFGAFLTHPIQSRDNFTRTGTLAQMELNTNTAKTEIFRAKTPLNTVDWQINTMVLISLCSRVIVFPLK